MKKRRGLVWMRDAKGTVWEQDSCHKSTEAAYKRLKAIKKERPQLKTKLCICHLDPMRRPNGDLPKEYCVYTIKMMKR